MNRLEVGYLLLAILLASISAGLWYAFRNSHRSTWLRSERKRRKRQEKTARVPAE